MSKKRKVYSAEFKSKLVLEVLEAEQTLNEIASKYEILPNNLKNWKKQFLENMSLAFDKSAVVKEYKEEIAQLQKSSDALAKKVGTLTIERDWLEGKLVSLDLSNRKEMIECQADNKTILNTIDLIYTKHPYYGHRRIHKLLLRLGYNIGRKMVIKAMKFMGIKALYPKPKTTIANKEHKKYPYLLNAFKNDKNQVIIEKPNQVWSTDITYIKLNRGFAYLSAIIDWNTKKILSWKLSNSMDVSLTTSVLKEALSLYPKPKIVNTDQGSQYTAKEHIDILVNNNISISMDGKGRSIDNIVIERFWRSLKYEDVYLQNYNTIKEARAGIGKYIKMYNQERLHSALDYATPDEVYFKGVNNYQFNTKDMLLKVS